MHPLLALAVLIATIGISNPALPVRGPLGVDPPPACPLSVPPICP
jgi:hypothetical protein